MKPRTSLAKRRAQARDLASGGVIRGRPHRPLELPQRLPPAPLPEVNPAQVHERVLPRLVACRLLGLLQPGDGFIRLALLHQIDPDVVVWIAKLGIDLDRPAAFVGGLVESALGAQGPAQEGVRLRGGVDFDGPLVALHGPIQFAVHLVAIGFLPQLPGPPQTVWLLHHGRGLLSSAR